MPKRWDMLPPVPKARGNATEAFAKAFATLDAEYRLPVEHHNPMELFGTTVVWEDGHLTVYDKTQGVQNVQGYLGAMLGYDREHVRVFAPFVGGAFGLGLRPQNQVFLAALAAHVLKRSVRVSLTRQQMFGLGYRPVTWQRVRLGAAQDGSLAAIIHDAVAATSRFEDYTEKTVQSSGMLYRCDNATFDYKLARLDLCTPIDMRAPGTATGLCALECAMDELAVSFASIRSTCGSRTTLRRIRRWASPFRASRCGTVIGKAQSASGGRAGNRRRGRCATETCSLAGGWQAAFTMPCRCQPPPHAR